LAIRFFTEDIRFNLPNKRILKTWIQNVITSHNKICGDVNFIFTSNNQILEINKKYLQHDYFTDIITFNYNQEVIISGDIYISIDTVKDNALNFSTTFLNEIHRVIIHGILHLIGYNDKSTTEQEQMRQAEDRSLVLLEEINK
jgi:rRNA maturation RNase YbeY